VRESAADHFNILATVGACSAILSSGKRLVIYADEKLTAFLELESATRGRGELA
jgi:hypothetical protein